MEYLAIENSEGQRTTSRWIASRGLAYEADFYAPTRPIFAASRPVSSLMSLACLAHLTDRRRVGELERYISQRCHRAIAGLSKARASQPKDTL
jgi:hypothetical protein